MIFSVYKVKYWLTSRKNYDILLKLVSNTVFILTWVNGTLLWSIVLKPFLFMKDQIV